MKDGKKMARKGRTKVIYKGTFVSKQSLVDFTNKNNTEKPFSPKSAIKLELIFQQVSLNSLTMILH